jgi:hypothetical protein
MKDLYVIGGQQKQDAFRKDESHRYKKGLIVRIHPEKGLLETCVEYASPPEACAAEEDPAILFKAATKDRDKLYVCTSPEISAKRTRARARRSPATF